MELWLLILLMAPFAGVIINLLLNRIYQGREAGFVASLACLIASLAALIAFINLRANPEPIQLMLAPWIVGLDLDVSWAFRLDALSAVMALVVTIVSTLVHIYSVGYMKGDERFTTFFIYLNLFVGSMLILALADNFLVLFVGWELVGLCSYLLIGFWFDQGALGLGNARAGKKAFIANRIGDVGFLLALFLIFWQFGGLGFEQVLPRADEVLSLGSPIALAITLLMVLAVTGKSAQIPLLVWLPDAMAGPTPVSALIHSATMVTAGIYLVARSAALFALAPAAQLVLIIIGCFTSLYAASAALGQVDIKRLLAYSTISQLGFMVTAAGLGAYGAALFHLATHAFFKALLFLAAGSLIHALEHHAAKSSADFEPQDLRQMGGLLRRMPITAGLMALGGLALAGLPPLAGFFSKDEILTEALAAYPAVFAALALASLLTALYVGRLLGLALVGKPRSPAAEAAHENGRWMTVPMAGLGLGALLGGLANLPGVHWLTDWLNRTFGNLHPAEFNWLIAIGVTLLVLAALAYSFQQHRADRRGAAQADPVAGMLGGVANQMHAAWHLDDLYQKTVVRGYELLAAALGQTDQRAGYGLDRTMEQAASQLAQTASRTQTGQLNWNMLGIALGLGAVLIILSLGGMP